MATQDNTNPSTDLWHCDCLEKACVLLKDTPKERQGHGLLRWAWSPQQNLANTEKEAHTIQDKSPQNAAITEKEGNMEENKFLVPSGLSTKICEDLAEEIRHAAPDTLVQAILLLNDAESTTSFPRLSQRDFPTRQDYKRALLERGLDYVSKKVQPILDKLEKIPLRVFRGSELFGMIHIEGTAQAIQQAATLPEVRRVALNAKLQAPTDAVFSAASPTNHRMQRSD